MSATRIRDRHPVVLKKLKTSDLELPLTISLSSRTPPTPSDNHCVPVLDVVLYPDTDEHVFMVLPLLHLLYPPICETADEVLHCIRELLKVARELLTDLTY